MRICIPTGHSTGSWLSERRKEGKEQGREEGREGGGGGRAKAEVVPLLVPRPLPWLLSRVAGCGEGVSLSPLAQPASAPN